MHTKEILRLTGGMQQCRTCLATTPDCGHSTRGILIPEPNLHNLPPTERRLVLAGHVHVVHAAVLIYTDEIWAFSLCSYDPCLFAIVLQSCVCACVCPGVYQGLCS